MKAIVTTFRGPTSTRGASIYATAEGVPRLRLGYSYEGDAYEEHERAAHALMKRLGWTGRIAGGSLPDGRSYAWVFVPSARRRTR